MNYWAAVRKTLLYIEENLKAEISLTELAQIAGYSEYHFSRLFKDETGFSVMEYVRRRRLVHALAAMDAGSDMINAAMDYGFDTQGGFIKAFQKIYGCTPGRYCIQFLGKLSNNIQLISIRHRKDDINMQINTIENENVYKKVIILTDRMFNITAQGDGKYGYSFWEKHFLETPELMVYAEDEGNICGLAFGWVDNMTVTVAYLGVEEEYRGRGIGRALLNELENRALALGYHGMALGSSVGEEGFYEKCGYKGTLLIQSEVNTIDELRSLNPGYEEINARVYEGYVNQLFLKIPGINRELQRKYEETYPACNTIMVFGKAI
jgi:AraC-like DNA-binding protein/GNAT superfamily N-acetyltransferase